MLHPKVVDFRPFRYSSPSNGMGAAKMNFNEFVILSCGVDFDSVSRTRLVELNVAVPVCADVDVFGKLIECAKERRGLVESVEYLHG